MSCKRYTHYQRSPRARGSIYVMVLGASLIVAIIGISSLTTSRVQRASVTASSDRIKARELARTAIDRGLWEIKNNALLWRTTFEADTYTDITFGDGTFTIAATDPTDNDLLDDNTDPVVLLGIGECGIARYMIKVTLYSDGEVVPGTWTRFIE